MQIHHNYAYIACMASIREFHVEMADEQKNFLMEER